MSLTALPLTFLPLTAFPLTAVNCTQADEHTQSSRVAAAAQQLRDNNIAAAAQQLRDNTSAAAAERQRANVAAAAAARLRRIAEAAEVYIHILHYNSLHYYSSQPLVNMNPSIIRSVLLCASSSALARSVLTNSQRIALTPQWRSNLHNNRHVPYFQTLCSAQPSTLRFAHVASACVFVCAHRRRRPPKHFEPLKSNA